MTISTSCTATSKTSGAVRSSMITMENKSPYFALRVFISLAFDRDLPVPVTLIPRSRRRSTTWAPIKPVAPVTRTWLGGGRLFFVRAYCTCERWYSPRSRRHYATVRCRFGLGDHLTSAPTSAIYHSLSRDRPRCRPGLFLISFPLLRRQRTPDRYT